MFQYYRDCIIKAETEVLIAAGFWRRSRAVDIVSAALRELNERLARESAETGVMKQVIVKIVSFVVSKGNLFDG